ncbi:hypothetical protein Pint_13083 [Pistacia integerrima]|uniref:Uncharacterized protein n=1 Tax=Pistacia integerrima TaxID=434235 RepID=A0ACC0Y788_9ROSI|nr:hypothetical protein Pint_13083 [Pistacia integerrima]
MATTTRLAHQTFRLNAAVSFTSCQPGARGLTRLPLPPKVFKSRNLAVKTNQNLKWAVRLNLVNQSSPPKSTVDVERLVGFLYDDLPHLFDDQGIDRAAYDEQVKFRDPITKHDTIGGYLFNISLLKKLFRPDFQLHWVKQTGPYEITTRWTMVMKFVLLPWKPELIFTGTSVMGINPDTGKFCSHVDFWDSIVNNDYFSLEGLWDVFKQLRVYKTPDLETPKYQILKRTANYEVVCFILDRLLLIHYLYAYTLLQKSASLQTYPQFFERHRSYAFLSD